MAGTNRCPTSTMTAENELRVVGGEDVAVGNARIRAIHIRVLAKLTGEQRGTSVRDGWLSESGLRLKEISKTDADSNLPVAGRTHYHEEYELRLMSLSPQT